MSSVEVRTDAWALARLHRAPERPSLEALGYTHLGYVFNQAPGSSWERGVIGYTTEVLASPDRTTLAELDLFFDVGIVSLATLLEDGTIVLTRYVPEAAAGATINSWLTFASRPGAGRPAETFDTWDGARMTSLHEARVTRLRERRGCGVVTHKDLAGHFAMDTRGLEIARATGALLGRLDRVVTGLLIAAVVGAGLLCVGGVDAKRVAALTALSVVAWFFAPLMTLTARFTRLPLEPAAAMLSRPEILEQVGDHAVVPGRVS